MMELIISTGTEEIGASHTQNIAAARAQTHVKTMERKRERDRYLDWDPKQKDIKQM